MKDSTKRWESRGWRVALARRQARPMGPCPYCEAPKGEPCQTKNNNERVPHQARWDEFNGMNSMSELEREPVSDRVKLICQRIQVAIPEESTADEVSQAIQVIAAQVLVNTGDTVEMFVEGMQDVIRQVWQMLKDPRHPVGDTFEGRPLTQRARPN